MPSGATIRSRATAPAVRTSAGGRRPSSGLGGCCGPFNRQRCKRWGHPSSDRCRRPSGGCRLARERRARGVAWELHGRWQPAAGTVGACPCWGKGSLAHVVPRELLTSLLLATFRHVPRQDHVDLDREQSLGKEMVGFSGTMAPPRAAIRSQKHPGSAQNVRRPVGHAGQLCTPLGCGHRRVKGQSQGPRRQAFDLLTSGRQPPMVVAPLRCFRLCPTVTAIRLEIATFDDSYIATSRRRARRHPTPDTRGLRAPSMSI
jgi:hypothetical protein